MTYISNYTPNQFNKFGPHFLRPKEAKNFHEQKKIENDKIKNQQEIQFRNSGDVKTEKKPCGCMANKFK